MSTQDTKSTGIRRAPTSASSKGTAPSGPITIEIQGQRLNIRSDRDPAFVHGLARYIDQKLSTLHAAAPTATMDKLLMLASMTVAEELFETRQELGQLRGHLEKKTETIVAILDRMEEI